MIIFQVQVVNHKLETCASGVHLKSYRNIEQFLNATSNHINAHFKPILHLKFFYEEKNKKFLETDYLPADRIEAGRRDISPPSARGHFDLSLKNRNFLFCIT